MTLELIDAKLLKPFKYPRIVHEGYLYHFHKKCSHHLRWKCSRVYSSKCQCVLRTSSDWLDLEFIAVDHQHIHENDHYAITELKLKISTHLKSSMFQNSTMFKPKKIGVRHEPDDSLRYVEDQNSIATSSNFEKCPNNKLEQSIYQDQIELVNFIDTNSSEINDVEHWIAENNTSCFSFNDKNNIFNQAYEELPLEQIMMDTTCKTIEVNEKEKDEDIMNKVSTNLKNNSSSDLNTSKLYQEYINSKIHLTESDTDISAAQFKKMNMNDLCPMIFESNEDTPSVTTISIKSPKSIKRRRNINSLESSPEYDKIKLKKMNMNRSASLPFNDLSENESLDTTISKTKPESLKSKKKNLTKSETCITTRSKIKNMNKPSSPLLIDLNEDGPSDTKSSKIRQELSNSNLKNVTQSDTGVKLTQTTIIESNKPSTSAFVGIVGDSTPAMTTLSLSCNLLNSQQSILTQNDTEINKSNLIENNASSTPVCSVLPVDRLPAEAASKIRSKEKMLTQFRKDTDIIPSISVSTDLSSNLLKSPEKMPNRVTTLTEEVILPAVIRRYDRTTKKFTYLFPKLNKPENNTHKPNLVDIKNIKYEPKSSCQDNPTIPDVVHEKPNSDTSMISQPLDSVPQALPLLPSIITHVSTDQMNIQEPNIKDILTIFNETTTLPTPTLSLTTNDARPEPNVTLSWTFNTNSVVDTIKAYEIFSCEPSSGTQDIDKNLWKLTGEVNAEPGIMTCTLIGIGLKGKTFFFTVRAKNLQDVNGPFSRPVSFQFL